MKTRILSLVFICLVFALITCKKDDSNHNKGVSGGNVITPFFGDPKIILDKPFYSVTDSISGSITVPTNSTCLIKFESQSIEMQKSGPFFFKTNTLGQKQIQLLTVNSDGLKKSVNYSTVIFKNNDLITIWNGLKNGSFDSYRTALVKINEQVEFTSSDYRGSKKMNIEFIKGFFGINYFYFNKITNGIDSIKIYNGDTGRDPSLSLSAVYSDLQPIYGKSSIGDTDNDFFGIKNNGLIIYVSKYNSHKNIISKITKE